MKFGHTVLYSGSSQYGSYRIIESTYNNRPARLLYGAGNSPQSGIALDDDPELLFDYNQRFLEIIMSRQPHKLLVIGGGACTLPTAAYQLFPDLTIDVVEVDKLLIDLAYRFFGLPRSPRLQIIIDDAVDYIAQTGEHYDMIIIDAFLGYTVPPTLLQLSTIMQYRRHLTPKGSVAINFISEYKDNQPDLAHEVVASFSEAFPSVALFQSDPHYFRGEEQNLILAAGSGSLHFDYLQSEEVVPA